MLVILRIQRVKYISIRAMSYDRSNICNAWWKKGKKQNKQTEKQNRRGQILLQTNILCFKWTPWFGAEMSNIMKENDERYLSLTCWTSLEATLSVCFADFFNLLGTTSSSSVETTSKYNSSAIIFKFYLRQSGLMVSVLNPEWSRWLCFL